MYSTAITAAGGYEKVLANWFPLALEPDVRPWLMHLPKNSILSWDELCDHFVGVFQGCYKCPGTVSDLHPLIQKPNETLREYIQCFTQVQHTASPTSLL